MSRHLNSSEKQNWWKRAWPKHLPKQPRLSVFHFAMNSTPRREAPDESIGYGYMTHGGFGEGDFLALFDVFAELDPEFFDSYPRTEAEATLDGDPFAAFIVIVIEAARVFYGYGVDGSAKSLETN